MARKPRDGEEIKGKIIGEKLIKIMSKQNVTVKELSEATGLTVNTISRIRNNRNGVSGSSLDKISEALGVSTAVFEDGSEELMLNSMIVKALAGLPEDIVGILTDALGDKRKLEYILVGIKIAEDFSTPADMCYIIVKNYEWLKAQSDCNRR